MVKQLHVISTGKQSIGTLAHIAKDIYPYIDYIHLRERTWSASTFIQAIEAFMSKGIPRCKIIVNDRVDVAHATNVGGVQLARSEEHTSELQSRFDLVCRLLLEKKKKYIKYV